MEGGRFESREGGIEGRPEREPSGLSRPKLGDYVRALLVLEGDVEGIFVSIQDDGKLSMVLDLADEQHICLASTMQVVDIPKGLESWVAEVREAIHRG